MSRPKQLYDMIEVVWDDASALRHGWEDRNFIDKPKPALALSVGFLIKKTDDHIIIAQDTDDDGQHNGRSQIPVGMVKSIRVLRKADKKKGK